MGKMFIMLFNSITTIIWVLCGGFRSISWSWTRKYGVPVAIVPESKLRGMPAVAAPSFFGGMVFLSDEMLDLGDGIVRFTILHEKAHCRKWRAMPGLVASLKGKGHGKKTAAYEYIADQYAAEHGEVLGGIELLTLCHEAWKDPEIREQVIASGSDPRDPIRRVRALKRWIARQCRDSV